MNGLRKVGLPFHLLVPHALDKVSDIISVSDCKHPFLDVMVWIKPSFYNFIPLLKLFVCQRVYQLLDFPGNSGVKKAIDTFFT